MYAAYALLTNRIGVKAKEHPIANGLLLCAVQVVDFYKDFFDVLERKNEMDGFIAHAYTGQLIEGLIWKAKKYLLSPLPKQQQQGSNLVELINEKDLDQYPEYKAYRHILYSIIGEAPVMYLHLLALMQVAEQSRSLRRRYQKATITEIVMTQDLEKVNNYLDENVPAIIIQTVTDSSK
jgi:hypothetical protein